MKLLDHVLCVFEDVGRGRSDLALLHSCTAIDATARALYPSEISNSKRFKRCIREYYWLIEPMIGVGVNLVDTKFTNVTAIRGNKQPDFADLVYHLFRCKHAHGEDVPIEYSFVISPDPFHSFWEFGANSVQMPDKVIWALIAVAVFSRVNYRCRGKGGNYRVSWGDEIFPIADWWGKEPEIREHAIRWNTQRTEFRDLCNLNAADAALGRILHLLSVAPEPTPSQT